MLGSFFKDFEEERFIRNIVFKRWATRSPLEVAAAAGGSWPIRRHFEEERFIAKYCFGALSDQELFWDCPSCLRLSGEGCGSLGCFGAF